MNESDSVNLQDNKVSYQSNNDGSQNSFVITLLSVLLMLSVLIAGYFAIKTQDLVKELNKLKMSATPTAVSPTENPISDWIVYKFNPIKLELKAPKDFTVESSEPNPGEDFTAYIQNAAFNNADIDNSYQLYIFWQKSQTVTEKEFQLLKNELNPESIEETTVDGKSAIKGQIKGERNRFVTYILNNRSKISFLTSQPTEANKKTTDQILSTIKFTEDEQIFCTMEAKICPDGSSVGRSGPKCEFTPCPELKN